MFLKKRKNQCCFWKMIQKKANGTEGRLHVLLIILSFRSIKMSRLVSQSLNGSRTRSGSDQAAGEVGTGKPLLQDGDDLLVEVLHGHGGDIPQLLKHLVRSLRRARGVHIPQNTVNLVDHLQGAEENNQITRDFQFVKSKSSFARVLCVVAREACF